MSVKVALVAHNIHDQGGMERSLAELVRRTSDRVDFHLVAAGIAEDLRGTIPWTRVPVPQRPVPLFFSSFYAAAAAAVTRLNVDLVHTMGAVYPGKADLVSVQFCHAAFGELPSGTRAVSGGRLRQVNRRLDLAISTAAERRSYRPSKV
ncbi:MAG: hypothetical protein JWO90_376, partial [Solirubrobacterales bacterium]|nr:hypothetical protein [Solirubrobacterales bacterium]